MGSMMKSMVKEARVGPDTLRRIVGVICAFILCVILIAGLFPFRPPRNDVRWLQGENGIRFGNRGIVVSTAPFLSDSGEGPCSLEIYLRPASVSQSGTIVALDDNPDPKYVFALRQFDGRLALQRPEYDAHRGLVRQWWWSSANVFEEGKRVVLTITSNQGKTALYVDGRAAGASSEFGLTSGDLAGRVVLGSSATQDTWRGDIFGLAIYRGALTPGRIEEHAARWLRGQPPTSGGEEPPLDLYRFDEGNGPLIHDQGASGNPLLIRARYFVLHPGFLTPVWAAYRSRWDGWMTKSYWSDVSINIAGFVPFGFFFAFWLSLIPSVSRPRFTALLLGMTISLTIESLQYFLPTRDSSMTDLLTNTIGTAVGVALYRPSQLQALMAWSLAAGRWRQARAVQRNEPNRNGSKTAA
jgi:hypothetical protein